MCAAYFVMGCVLVDLNCETAVVPFCFPPQRHRWHMQLNPPATRLHLLACPHLCYRAATLKRTKDALQDAGLRLQRVLPPFVHDAALSSHEASTRKLMLTRLTEEHKRASTQYAQLATRAQDAVARSPAPTGTGAPASFTSMSAPGSGASAVAGSGSGRGGASSSSATGGARRRDDATAQAMAQMHQVDLTTALIDERHEDIEHVAREMQGVHEAFSEVASLVQTQGQTLVKVETNVVDAHSATEKGVGHLTEASRLQRKYRGCLLILLLILLFVAAGITTYFVLKNKK